MSEQQVIRDAWACLVEVCTERVVDIAERLSRRELSLADINAAVGDARVVAPALEEARLCLRACDDGEAPSLSTTLAALHQAPTRRTAKLAASLRAVRALMVEPSQKGAA